MGKQTRLRSPLRKLATLGLAASAFAFLCGCHMNGHQSTMHVEGRVAQTQLDLFYVTFYVTLFIFITVGSALAYAQIKFRARKGDDDKEPPEQSHGHPMVEMGLIIASTLLLVIIAIPTVKGIVYSEDTPDRENALVVKVTGYQWWFKFEYPELGLVTANEMVIPTGRPIHIELRTVDVIHSFWVPKLAGKKDLVPNRNNHMWLQAEQANYYWAQCAEYCGESHANMRFRVVSLNEPEFSAWVTRQKADARNVGTNVADAANEVPRVQFVAAAMNEDTGVTGAPSPFAYWQMKQAEVEAGKEDAAQIAKGRQLFQDRTCSGCHTVRGHGYMGITGPDLTHFCSRTTIAAAVLDSTTSNLHRWLNDPNEVKPGNLMWRTGGIGDPARIKLKPDEIDALVAYLQSLK